MFKTFAAGVWHADESDDLVEVRDQRAVVLNGDDVVPTGCDLLQLRLVGLVRHADDEDGDAGVLESLRLDERRAGVHVRSAVGDDDRRVRDRFSSAVRRVEDHLAQIAAKRRRKRTVNSLSWVVSMTSSLLCASADKHRLNTCLFYYCNYV